LVDGEVNKKDKPLVKKETFFLVVFVNDASSSIMQDNEKKIYLKKEDDYMFKCIHVGNDSELLLDPLCEIVENVAWIFFVFCCDETRKGDGKQLSKQASNSLNIVLKWLQVLGVSEEAYGHNLLNVACVSQNGVCLSELEEVPNLSQSVFMGFCRSVRLELPSFKRKIRMFCLDIDTKIKYHDTFHDLLFSQLKVFLTFWNSKEEKSNTCDLDLVIRRKQLTDVAKSEEKNDGIEAFEFFVPRLEYYGKNVNGPIELYMKERGAISNLIPRPQAYDSRVVPREGQVEIRVRAIGLNFRDVLNIMGLYPGDAGPLGADVSGVVVAVGDNVNHLAVGDAVFGIAPGCLKTFVTTDAYLIRRMPQNLSFPHAAAMPVVGVTVNLTISHIANVKQGDKVLIHAASGGVGLVAVQHCLQVGATVYATVGSHEKEMYLRSLGIKYITSSRNIDKFAKDMETFWENDKNKEETSQFLDVVLNCLVGFFISGSLRFLKKGGCFLELGKRQIYSVETMKEERPDVRYHIVALDDLISSSPKWFGEQLDMLCEQIEKKTLKPLPVEIFDFKTSALDGFRRLQRAQHIGKVVLQNSACSDKLKHGGNHKSSFIDCIVISGGLGELGLVVTQFFIEEGFRHIILLTRQAFDSVQIEYFSQLRPQIHIEVCTCDVTSQKDVFEAFEVLKTKGYCIRGLVHCAGILKDESIQTALCENTEKVMEPKVAGAWNLHVACQQLNIEDSLLFFIVFSSVTSVLGNYHQSNYAAANNFLDTFAQYRKSLDLTCLSIQWGPWIEQGMASKLKKILKQSGLCGITNELALRVFHDLVLETIEVKYPTRKSVHGYICADSQESALSNNDEKKNISSLVLCQNFHWASFFNRYENGIPLFFERVKMEQTICNNAVVDIFRVMDSKKRREFVMGHVISCAHQILGTTTALSFDAPLHELGVDSLAAVEFRNLLSMQLGVKLSATALFDYPTLNNIADYTVEILSEDLEKKIVLEKRKMSENQLNSKTVSKDSHEVLSPSLHSNEENLKMLAVVSLSCRVPGPSGNTGDAFFNNLQKGIDCITRIPSRRWNCDKYYDADADTPKKCYVRHGGFINQIDQFDSAYFDLDTVQVKAMDPQQRIMLEIAAETFYNAHILSSYMLNENGSRTLQLMSRKKKRKQLVGVFIGSSNNDWQWVQQLNSLNVFSNGGGSNCLIANRISHVFGLTGPSIMIDTACSSSLVALDLARTFCLNTRENDGAFVGGVNLMLTPHVFISLCKARMLSRDGRCKSFDNAADGYGRGEAAGGIYLLPLDIAQNDRHFIYAVLKSTAIKHSGQIDTIVPPKCSAQTDVILKALHIAKRAPDDILFVETHGLGTQIGDPIEIEALQNVFKTSNQLPVSPFLGAVKSNIGHSEGAAGIISFIKTCLVLSKMIIPPNLYFYKLNQHIEIDKDIWCPIFPEKCYTLKDKDEPVVASVNAFGFGGTYAHAVVEQTPLWFRMALKQTKQFLQPIQISETTSTKPSSLASSSSVLLQGKKRMVYKKIVFIFTGQGAQYHKMGQVFFEQEPVYRKAFLYCSKIALPHLGVGLETIVYDNNDQLDLTIYSQPAIFALEYALSELWKSKGIKPTAVLGHSLGEYAAAVYVGVMSVEEAMYLIICRARLVCQIPNERHVMVACRATAQQAEIVLHYLNKKELATSVGIGAINGPKSIVLSGKKNEVQRVVHELHLSNPVKYLPVSYAFHSPLMKTSGIVDEFLRILQKDVTFHPIASDIIFVSTVTGQVASNKTLQDPQYWASHIAKPTLFYEGIITAHQLGGTTFVELGPKSTLTPLAYQCLQHASVKKHSPLEFYTSINTHYGNEKQILVFHKVVKCVTETQGVSELSQECQCREELLLANNVGETEDQFIATRKSRCSVRKDGNGVEVKEEKGWSKNVEDGSALVGDEARIRDEDGGVVKEDAILLPPSPLVFERQTFAWVPLHHPLLITQIQVCQGVVYSGTLGVDFQKFVEDFSIGHIPMCPSSFLLEIMASAIDRQLVHHNCRWIDSKQVVLLQNIIFTLPLFTLPHVFETNQAEFFVHVTPNYHEEKAQCSNLFTDKKFSLVLRSTSGHHTSSGEEVTPFSNMPSTVKHACCESAKYVGKTDLEMSQKDFTAIQQECTEEVKNKNEFYSLLHENDYECSNQFQTITEVQISKDKRSAYGYLQSNDTDIFLESGCRVSGIVLNTGVQVATFLVCLLSKQNRPWVPTVIKSALIGVQPVSSFSSTQLVVGANVNEVLLDKISCNIYIGYISDVQKNKTRQPYVYCDTQCGMSTNTIPTLFASLLKVDFKPFQLMNFFRPPQAFLSHVKWREYGMNACELSNHSSDLQMNNSAECVASPSMLLGKAISNMESLQTQVTNTYNVFQESLAEMTLHKEEQRSLHLKSFVWVVGEECIMNFETLSPKTIQYKGFKSISELVYYVEKDILPTTPLHEPSRFINTYGQCSFEILYCTMLQGSNDFPKLLNSINELATLVCFLKKTLNDFFAPNVWIFTRGCQRENITNDSSPPILACIWGYVRVIRLELECLFQKKINFHCVDLQESFSTTTHFKEVCNKLLEMRQMMDRDKSYNFLYQEKDTVVKFDTTTGTSSPSFYVARTYPIHLMLKGACEAKLNKLGSLKSLSVRFSRREENCSSKQEVCCKANHAEFSCSQSLITLKKNWCEIRVYAIGVDWRDIQNIYDKRTISLGKDFAGIVTSVGSDVSHIKLGDAVFGISTESLSTFCKMSANLVQPIPEEMSFEQAAVLPSLSILLYYGFYSVAELNYKHTVLIHDSCGILGDVAIHLCRCANVAMYITVSDKTTYELYASKKIKNIIKLYDSDDLKRFLEIYGVKNNFSVLLNCSLLPLPEIIMKLFKPSSNTCKKCHFLQFISTTTQFDTFTYPNVETHYLNFQNLLEEIPNDVCDMFKRICERPTFIDNAQLKCFQLCLHHCGIYNAINMLKEKKLQTKVVLTLPNCFKDFPNNVESKKYHHNINKCSLLENITFLVIGNLSCFVQLFLEWLLFEKFACVVFVSISQKNVLSRSQVPEKFLHFSRLIQRSCDITDTNAVKNLLKEFTNTDTFPPLKGILYIPVDVFNKESVTRKECEMYRLTESYLLGAWNIHNILHDLNMEKQLQWFIVFTSSFTQSGHFQKISSAMITAGMNALVAYRETKGLAAQSVEWATHLLTKQVQEIDSSQLETSFDIRKKGQHDLFAKLTNDLVMRVLHEIFQKPLQKENSETVRNNEKTQCDENKLSDEEENLVFAAAPYCTSYLPLYVNVGAVNWWNALNVAEGIKFFYSVVLKEEFHVANSSGICLPLESRELMRRVESYIDHIKCQSASDREMFVTEKIIQLICFFHQDEFFEFSVHSDTLNVPIGHLGFDSLGIIEFHNIVELIFGIQLRLAWFFEYPTLCEIIEHVMMGIEQAIEECKLGEPALMEISSHLLLLRNTCLFPSNTSSSTCLPHHLKVSNQLNGTMSFESTTRSISVCTEPMSVSFPVMVSQTLSSNSTLTG
jgi:acyl transferase domain-containing protein/NADPH:quinone reductase-like Zn-dependent oxidoreductase/acyl carrier protein/NADP-dependent 3-hydroxy acid dehydrogenase YdfG